MLLNVNWTAGEQNRRTGHADDDDNHGLLLEIGTPRADGEATDGVRELVAFSIPLLRLALPLGVRLHMLDSKGAEQSLPWP